LLTTIQTSGWSLEQNGTWTTEDTTQWIDQVGALKYSHHYTELLYQFADSFICVVLTSFNNIPIQETGVMHRPVRHASGNQLAQNCTSKYLLLKSFVAAKSIPGYYFNLRGQAVACPRNSQIILLLPR
jgi:hypothetical protein